MQVAATCLGRAERALDLPNNGPSIACSSAADRQVPGRGIQARDMAVELRAAELLTLERPGSWIRNRHRHRHGHGKAQVHGNAGHGGDEALQIHGGMGLMTELPLERIWRDAANRTHLGCTSEVQRHIISRALLRPLGG